MGKPKTNPSPQLLERRQFLHLYGGALVAAVLSAGCGSGSVGPIPGRPVPPGTTPTPTPTPTQPGTPTPTPTPSPGGGDSRIVIRPEVAVLPADGTVQIADLGGGAFGLRGVSAPVSVGSVLVSAAGAGLLRKVTTVRPPEPDGAIVVETVQATLEDVFVKAEFSARLPVNASDVARIETIEGVEYIGEPVGGAGRSQSITRSRDFTTISNFEFAVKSTHIMGTTEDEINGKIKFKLEMELDGRIDDGKVQEFTCIFHVTPAAEVEFLCKKKFQHSFFKVKYAEFYMNPIIFAIGGVPVVVVPQFSLTAEMNGAVEGGVSFTCGFAVPSKVGARYTAAGGWDGVATAQPTGNYFPKANAFAAIKLEFNPVRVDAKLMLYGVVGPQVSLSAPSFEVKLLGKAGSDHSVKLTGAVGAKASASVQVEVIGKELASYESKNALEFKDVVFEKTFLPGAAEVEVL